MKKLILSSLICLFALSFTITEMSAYYRNEEHRGNKQCLITIVSELTGYTVEEIYQMCKSGKSLTTIAEDAGKLAEFQEQLSLHHDNHLSNRGGCGLINQDYYNETGQNNSGNQGNGQHGGHHGNSGGHHGNGNRK